MNLLDKKVVVATLAENYKVGMVPLFGNGWLSLLITHVLDVLPPLIASILIITPLIRPGITS